MRDSGWMRSALAVLGVAGVLAVSACGDGTTPGPSASGSSTPAPQSSSAPPEPQKATPEHPAQNLVPPELPEEATEFTDEGFKAFIEYWFEARNYGIATTDDSYIRAVSSKDCPYCITTLEMTENIARGGGDVWIVGGEIQATDITATVHGDSGDSDRTQLAYFTLRKSSGDAYGKDGIVEDGANVIEAVVKPFEFEARYEEGAWTATRIEVEH
ncbi:DUF6318 family protein [Zhihengliuella salsuginis]|uniref:DUF6318 domain-containing protein n=1 Tax=Zhihengliuella salsuginis TaxID=578222 RepID=A0ABQ3GJ48_9MICC|nr:DUF6318 family protein [Zhihengliuella salsuginis]GHD06088.1 hypothetical protein GCM10008096_15650 [Zhihengliuella salsuginis]